MRRSPREAARTTVRWLLNSVTAVCLVAAPALGGEDGSQETDSARETAELWTPGPADKVLPGVISSPAVLPNAGRWQVVRVIPRCYMYSVCWSPDGKRIAHTDGDYVRISNPTTMEIEHVLVGHTEAVKTVAWSPDGERILSAGEDQTIRMWNADGSPERVLQGHQQQVNAVCWSPKGDQFASAASDGTVRFWNVDGSAGPVIKADKNRVLTVHWSPDGKRLLVGGDDRLVKIWSTDGTAGPTLDGHFGPISTVEWSPDGSHILSGSLGAESTGEDERPVSTVRIWKADGTPVALCRGHKDSINSVTWSPDGQQIVTTCEDRILRIFDSSGGEVNSADNVFGTSAKLSPDGKRVAIVGREWINVYDMNKLPSRQRHFQPRQYFDSVEWSPDGKSIAASGRHHKIYVWHADGRERSVIDGLKYQIRTLGWSPDGETLAAGGAGHSVKLWSADGTPGPELRGHTTSIVAVQWSPDGKWIASAGRNTGTVRLWHIDGRRGPVMQGFAKHTLSIAWKPDSRRLALGGSDGFITLWDPDDGALLSELEIGHGDIDAVGWKADGTSLAAGSDGIWTLVKSDGEKVAEQQGHQSAVMGIAFSPDGQHIASVAWDHRVKLWHADGSPDRTVKGHTAPAVAVSWNPNSQQFASSGNDGAVHVWNVESGRTDWSALYLHDDIMITLTSAGQLISRDPDAAEKGLRYLVEKPNGAMEVLKYSEFLKRVGSDETP